MIRVLRCNNFGAKDLLSGGPRRGFVIPVPREPNKSLLIADTDSSVNHDDLADKFIFLTEEQLAKIVSEQPVETPEDFEKALKMCKDIQKSYRDNEKDYPTSRKDYLLYEEGAVAFDSRSIYGKFILYRDSAKGFRISSQTDRIVCDFIKNNWKAEPVPEDSKNASTRFF